jgi:hypothetical protein
MKQANSITKRDKTRNQNIFFKKSFLLDQDNILLYVIDGRVCVCVYIYLHLFIASWMCMHQSCIDRHTNKNTVVPTNYLAFNRYTRSTICF